MVSSGSQLTISNLRRHSDPPALWGIVLLGSLLLNGGVILAFSQYVQRLEPVTTQFAPIAVDFLPTASPVNSTAPQARSTSPTKERSTTSTAAPAAPNKPSNPAVTGSNPSNAALSSPIKPSPEQAIPTQATTQPASTSPIPPSTVTPASAASPDQAATPPPTNTQQVIISGIPLPDFAPPPDPEINSGASSPPSNTLPLNRNAAVTKFVAQVTVLPQADEQSNFVAHTEQTQQTKMLASGEAGCFVLPEALRHFNQPEEFALTLNETGTVVNAAPTTPDAIANKSYQQLAICTLKTLSFNHLVLPSATESNSTKLAVQVILQKQ